EHLLARQHLLEAALEATPLVEREADDVPGRRIEQDVPDLGDVIAGQGDDGEPDEVGAADELLHDGPRFTATTPPRRRRLSHITSATATRTSTTSNTIHNHIGGLLDITTWCRGTPTLGEQTPPSRILMPTRHAVRAALASESEQGPEHRGDLVGQRGRGQRQVGG